MHFHRRCHFLWLAWRMKVSAVPEPMHPVDDSFCRHRFRERNHYIDGERLIDVVIGIYSNWLLECFFFGFTDMVRESQASKLLKVLLLSLIFQTSAWRTKLLFSWLCLGECPRSRSCWWLVWRFSYNLFEACVCLGDWCTTVPSVTAALALRRRIHSSPPIESH
jgi:hypothetical protein